MAAEHPEERRGSSISPVWHLLLASVVALYFEVLLIRYLSTEVRLFAYLKNFSLIAAFLGLGVGMIEERWSGRLRRHFPAIFAVLFLTIILAAPLGLARIGIPPVGLKVFGSAMRADLPVHQQVFLFAAVTGVLLGLVVVFFMPLGRLVGDGLKQLPGLRGYGINLLGSLLGLVLFTALSFSWLPPVAWLAIGVAGLAPFWWERKRALAVMAMVALFAYNPSRSITWSPYYRIDLGPPLQGLGGWERPHAYFLAVNHDYHQKMVELSPAFLAMHPEVEPNRSAALNYELPYRLVSHPRSVLVVGAGTGNDVAAALRHGATQVDAVEIDPAILDLGRRYHPEQPYASDKVRVHVEDARAFFRQTDRMYDLIVFAYLDAHTMLTSFSALRLDNYVYTAESLREARALLRPGGTLALSFASGVDFVDQRLYAMIKQAFDDVAPHVYLTGYDRAGLVFVSGGARTRAPVRDVEEIGDKLVAGNVVIPTDRWPFLYLASRSVPLPMILVLLVFIIGARRLVKAAGVADRVLREGRTLQFLLLGAGFLLLETKGVTETSLLFGSTWLTSAVVIAGFLAMALLANLAVAIRPLPVAVSYGGLFVALLVNALVPLTALAGLAFGTKIVAAGALVGLPVFFSGLVFSSLFRQAAAPAVALGANLLGATFGGVLENSVMIGGTPMLAVLAFGLYATAAFTTFRSQERNIPLARAAAPA